MNRRQIMAVIAVGVIAFTAMSLRDLWRVLGESAGGLD